MSARQEVINYIASAREKGFPDTAIAAALRNAGWRESDIREGFSPTASASMERRTLSPFIIVLSVILFLVFGGGAAYGLYWYQTQYKGTPTPTPAPTDMPVPTEAILPIASPSAHPSAPPATPSAQVPSDIPYAHDAFGFDILKALVKNADGKNTVISPTSISLALSMTYNGASESTKLAMANTMKVSKIDIKTLNEGNALLIKLLSNPDPQVTVAIANSIWLKKGLTLLPAFTDINTRYYNAMIQSLDFTLASSADTINAWVSKATKTKIPAIVAKPMDPSLVMYLINAVYFSGAWTHAFDATLTQMKPFTLSSNTKIQLPLMKQERNDFLYQETSVFQAVQLPFGKTGQLSMVILLPKTTLSALLGTMTHGTWVSWMKSFAPAKGTVLMPKYKIDYETSLKNALLALGMTPAFSSESANFSGMRTQRDLYISDVIHKTSMEVNERGTEATAATSVEMALTSAPSAKPFTMEVTKPFFTAIVDTASGEILFMGAIEDPSK